MQGNESSDRISSDLWLEIREHLIQNDPDATEMLDWSASLADQKIDASSLSAETTWIILCAGKTAQAARTIERRVLDALAQNRPVIEAYGHKGRAMAIEAAWRDQSARFERYLAIRNAPEALYEWCCSLPWVGPVTAFQLMKNLGVDCCKPDIWLCRLTGIGDSSRMSAIARFRACQQLCRTLAQVTGDRIASVDSLLWLACNKGIVQVSAEAGPVRLTHETSTRRRC